MSPNSTFRLGWGSYQKLNTEVICMASTYNVPCIQHKLFLTSFPYDCTPKVTRGTGPLKVYVLLKIISVVCRSHTKHFVTSNLAILLILYCLPFPVPHRSRTFVLGWCHLQKYFLEWCSLRQVIIWEKL